MNKMLLLNIFPLIFGENPEELNRNRYSPVAD